MSSPPKIRVGLVGLSASALVAWAEQGHLAYLLSTRGRSHYSVVALLNSSVSAAEAARSHFKLPSSVKCYGDPNTLAKDEEVDLVVVNTRVDVHYRTVEPSLRAGKSVYIEWPLVENLERAEELLQGKTYPDSIIGLQGRVSPITLCVKEILASGAVGKVLSSKVEAYGNLLRRDSFPDAVAYFGDRKVGGHQINIAFGHLLDYVHHTLGEFKEFDSRMQIQRPVKNVVGGNGNTIRTIDVNVPDLLSLHGTLAPGQTNIADGAILAFTFIHGQQFKGEPGLTWSINCENAELRITAPGPYLMSDSYDGPINIRLFDYATGEVKDLGWDWQDWQKELPIRTRIVAEVYERYVEWIQNGKPEKVEEGRNWPRLADAMVRMKEFDQLYKQFDPKW
jgi:predicted dehydrogenase